ncbi:MAG: hypothetical protein ACFB0B_04115, partial [Thermonemataceae bacterium]
TSFRFLMNRASGELGVAQNEPKTELASSAQLNQETDQRELSAAKSKAPAHKPAHLPAGFSSQRTYIKLKKDN